jgi:hypothetical protein
MNAGLLVPISKGQQSTIMHDHGENNTILKALLLLFKSRTKSGDYHHRTNSVNIWLFIMLCE